MMEDQAIAATFSDMTDVVASPALSTPPATVVITCYNHGRFLAEAIESVLTQTFRPVEIIVVDDGSTDDTAAVCQRYPTVRTIYQDNAGLSAARNTGLGAARGDLVAFLDADDLLAPEAIATGVTALADNPAWAFVYGGHIGVDAGRRPIWEQRPEQGAKDYESLLRRNGIGMHATVLYRRAVLQKVGGFDTSLRASEDYDMYLRIARDHPIGSHDRVVAEYRRHESNMSENPERMLRSSLAVLAAQKPTSQAERAARSDGMAFYQHGYGVPLVKRALRGVSSGESGAFRDLGLALRMAPRAFPHAAVDAGKTVGRAIERRVPTPIRRQLRRALARPPVVPAPGKVDWGDLARTTPIDPDFGYLRGTPVDRFYIERFLDARHGDIAGRVLEIGDNHYTMRFGAERVTQSDVLHVSPDAPQATICGDIADAPHIPDSTFDCIVFTQTLHLIFDIPAAIATLERILRPGGVLLLTVPGFSYMDRGEWNTTWYWGGLTTFAVQRLLGENWSEVVVESHGNVMAGVAFLHGMAADELPAEALAARDPVYQLIVTARAVKPVVPE